MQIRNAIFSRTNFAYDADPNVALPLQPAGVVPAAGSGNEGAPAFTPDWYHPQPGSLMLACARTSGGTSTVTVNVWIWDTQYSASAGNGGSWVLVSKALVVTEGVPQFVQVGGAYYQYFIQITAVTNTPLALLGYWANKAA